ncbi:MAG: winged helix-turn-helix domain-containing protein [Acidobacteria bacterium]|nr:winged helix-turn-helix domain-containing protein [Acidobacteriota bacterium]
MSSPAGRFRFGPFLVERAAYRVLRDGHILTLTPKLVDVLLYFVSRPSVLVTKDELLAAIWPDVTVTENALTQAISDLRQVLGDDPASPTYIQTVARRGYRFIAAVEVLPAAESGDSIVTVEPVGSGEFGMLRSIAVLDFTNVSGDKDLAWLAAGISETVTNDLTGFRVLRVVDRERVAGSTRRTDGSVTAVARDLGVHLVVVGSYQRVGDRLRITARIVDAPSGATLADAKVDGRLEDVFDLQDRIVRQFSAALGVEGAHGSSTRVGVRETANLEAFRAASEARVKIDSFDPAQVAAAVDGFERAVRLDPRYAIAHAGLANAHFLLYESTRARNEADTNLLATAIGHARRAVDLDDTMAEGHATLSFLLVSAGRHAEAVAAARRAVALEPQDWHHLFRLGHAAWGSERIDALRRTLAVYSELAFAHYEIAMVYVARNKLALAATVLRQGLELQDRQSGRSWRYPASGLHWLFGAVRLAEGDAAGALAEFRREIDTGPAGRIYSHAFKVDAHDGRGFALCVMKQPDKAIRAFEQTLALFPSHVRSLLGIALAHQGAGRKADAQGALARADAATAELERSGRKPEAMLVEAMASVVRGRPSDAVAQLDRLLAEAPPGYPGWSISIEPLLKPLHAQPEFATILDRVADRAR